MSFKVIIGVLGSGALLASVALAGWTQQAPAAAAADARIAAASCDAGDAASCFEAAGLHYNGSGVARNVGVANDFYLKGCNLGDGISCRNVAMISAQGALGAQDLNKATTYFVKACDAGDMQGCEFAAMHYERGTGAAQNYRTALSYHEKACNEGSRKGCIAVGSWLDAANEDYADRVGPRDLKRALPAYGALCNVHKVNVACFQAAVVQTELGNPGLALPFYREACRAGDAEACFNAALIYGRDGRYAKKSGGLSAIMMKHACDLKDARSCELLEGFIAKEDRDYLNGIDPLRPDAERYVIAFNDLQNAREQKTKEERFAYYFAWSTMAWLGEEGDINGIAFLGDAYMHGSNEYPQNYATAKVLLEQAYEAGNMDAAWDLGYIYALEWEKNKTDANKQRFMAPIKAAADAGHLEAKAYYEREMARERDYQRKVAETNARNQAIAEYNAQQLEALNEMNRRNKNAMDSATVARAWGAMSEPSRKDEVCAMILQNGRMYNECMSKDRFDKKYTPWGK